MSTRSLLYGLALWAAGTLALRFGGQWVLQPGHPVRAVVLFAVTLPVMAWVVRRWCRKSQLPRAQWPAAAIGIALPTLLLDSFSSAFFPYVFPNMVPEAAGLFGGWMLCCCGGALAGAVHRG